jgi:hypothetical protein
LSRYANERERGDEITELPSPLPPRRAINGHYQTAARMRDTRHVH